MRVLESLTLPRKRRDAQARSPVAVVLRTRLEGSRDSPKAASGTGSLGSPGRGIVSPNRRRRDEVSEAPKGSSDSAPTDYTSSVLAHFVGGRTRDEPDRDEVDFGTLV